MLCIPVTGTSPVSFSHARHTGGNKANRPTARHVDVDLRLEVPDHQIIQVNGRPAPHALARGTRCACAPGHFAAHAVEMQALAMIADVLIYFQSWAISGRIHVEI
ncbi:hypothetical protein [Ottowia sp.]|uniref:hypothetical protein n=1 Tax=Ottowia sp. TaxID=1898956 RepID=UPI0025FCE609|nr:hypothetical protein [Ottowia sp.]MBK6745652.1 hypothetical protein [Ottowia sp.]